MTDRRPPYDQNETPEDVATLYSWANLHGAKYRDFSASRAQTREKARLRVQQAMEEEQARAQLEHGQQPGAEDANDVQRMIEQHMADTARVQEEQRQAEVASRLAAERQAQQKAQQEAQWAAQLAAQQAAQRASQEAAEEAAQRAAEQAAQQEAQQEAQRQAQQEAQWAAQLAAQQAAERASQEAAEEAARQQAARQAAQQAAQQQAAEQAAQQQAAEQAAQQQAARQAAQQSALFATRQAAEHAAQQIARLGARHAAQQAAQQAAELAAQKAAEQAARQAALHAAEQAQAAQRAAQQAEAAQRELDAQRELAAERAGQYAAQQAARQAAQQAAWQQSLAEHYSAIPPAEPTPLAGFPQAPPPTAPPAPYSAPHYPPPFDFPGFVPPLSQRPTAAPPQYPPLREDSYIPPQNQWAAAERRENTGENTGRPAWLTPERPETPSQPATPQAPDDTLQGSRERLASRWYALRSLFDGPMPAEAAPAPVAARAPVVAVFSLAGGVGKTSLVATLGRALSARGERVLLVDTAPYGLLPFFFGARDQRPGLLRTFSPPGASSDAPIQMITLDPESLGPDTAGQEALTNEISTHARGVSRVIVDLATASGATTRRVMRMAPLVVVPMVPDMNSVVSVSSIDSFFQHNGSPAVKPSLPHYVLNQFDPTLPLHLDIREVLREQLGDRLLPFVIRRAPAVSEALAEGMTVMDYAPNSTVAEDFGGLASWVKSQSAPASTTYRGVRWSER